MNLNGENVNINFLPLEWSKSSFNWNIVILSCQSDGFIGQTHKYSECKTFSTISLSTVTISCDTLYHLHRHPVTTTHTHNRWPSANQLTIDMIRLSVVFQVGCAIAPTFHLGLRVPTVWLSVIHSNKSLSICKSISLWINTKVSNKQYLNPAVEYLKLWHFTTETS